MYTRAFWSLLDFFYRYRPACRTKKAGFGDGATKSLLTAGGWSVLQSQGPLESCSCLMHPDSHLCSKVGDSLCRQDPMTGEPQDQQSIF